MSHNYKLIFMGTPQFAVPGLRALHESGYDICLVVTQPDRPKGRGRIVTPSPVKAIAIDLGIQVIQPASIKTAEFSEQIKSHKPDFQIVIAYGKILSENILAIPRVGTINIHASLLPKLRGPAPIQWAVINGERQTGITAMLMDKGMDTGDILLTAPEPVLPEDTAGTLHDRLAVKGAKVLIETLKKFADRTIHPTPQDHSLATYAPLLSKDDGLIDWSESAQSLERFIRGVTPWPGAYTFFEETRLKIFKSAPIAAATAEPPGTVQQGFPDELRVATGDGMLSILEIQGAAAKRMPIKDYLKGHDIPPGSVLG